MLHVRLHLITADPPVLDRCIAFVEGEVRPAVEGQRDSLGLSLLASPELGVVVLETFWVSDAAVIASEDITAFYRGELAERAGKPVTEERYRIPVFERDEPPRAGAAVRLTRIEVKPSAVTDVIEVFGDTAVPLLAETPGFSSALLLDGHDPGHLVSETVWEGARARAASPRTAGLIRAEVLDAAGYVVRAVEDYSLAFSSARKP